MSGSPRLRIAEIAPPWFAVPPTGYGGSEWVVSLLTERLVARGHEVTLFAAGGSVTNARLVSTFPEPPSRLIGDAVIECRHLIDAYSRWREFDIIHDHTATGLLAAMCLDTPVVHTMHGPVTQSVSPLYQAICGKVALVAISQHQRSTLPPGCQATVIYNGTDLEQFAFGDRAGDYLLFVGRMSPEKGILEAIEIARGSRRPLKILAKINEPPEQDYFNRLVEPALAGVKYELRGQVTAEENTAATRGALATHFPIQWPEPFGLVMTESMASGTPVIAWRNGSTPEVVENGSTGFVVSSIQEAVEAVGRVGGLDRRACRRRVEEHFSAERNAEGYERLFQSLAEAGKTV